MKPAARAAARSSPEQKAEEEAAARKVAEEEAAAKKEKVEQCKKNLWGLPCTADGEVDRTAFGISRGAESLGGSS